MICGMCLSKISATLPFLLVIKKIAYSAPMVSRVGHGEAMEEGLVKNCPFWGRDWRGFGEHQRWQWKVSKTLSKMKPSPST